jgi:molecular chaperone GrpE
MADQLDDPLTESGAVRRDIAELRTRLLQLFAEVANYRRTAEENRAKVADDMRLRLLRHLVPVLDGLESELKSPPGDPERLKLGVLSLRDELLALLESEGVVAFEPLGQPFDPELHQALSYDVVPDFPAGMVSSVVRRGYRLGHKLLRPALVAVSKGVEVEVG